MTPCSENEPESSRPSPNQGGRGFALAIPIAALEFLTPLRLRPGGALGAASIGRSSAFFPAVGVLLGAILVGLDRGLSRVLPPEPVAGLLVAALVLLSGGLHLDGLADSADGLFGGRTPERRLAIMRDSRIGSFGTLAIVLVLLLEWSALLRLASPWRTPALLLFPALGRCALVVGIAGFPYARPEGLGVLFRRYVWSWPAPAAIVSALVLSVLLFGEGGFILWGVSLLFALVACAGMASRLGGLTGDTYGSACELTQILFLLLVLSGQRTGWLHPWLVRG